MELDKSHIEFIAEIKSQIKTARYNALQKVNAEQVNLYWNIGKTILERQKQFGWGKSIVEILSSELQKEFVGVDGFSARNLWRMKTLVDQYQHSSIILPPMVAEIPWTHNIIIIEKCKDEHERLFYIHLTKQNRWSKAMLISAIEAQNYQRTLINQTNFEQTLPATTAQDADMFVKDEYLFDFLNLSEPYTEAQLEQAILSNIRNFLIELGGDFAFLGNQYPLRVDNRTFEIDLLLYHRQLQCLVAIELKTDEFQPDFAGKMNFYLSTLNQTVKKQHEKPSIGIIICKSKSRTIVEFALQDINKPIGIATYSLVEKLPESIQQFFPSNNEFIDRVESITNYIQNKNTKK
jgi:predicted nuclease of restriction endonuclease-like (RecB) superfamily